MSTYKFIIENNKINPFSNHLNLKVLFVPYSTILHNCNSNNVNLIELNDIKSIINFESNDLFIEYTTGKSYRVKNYNKNIFVYFKNDNSEAKSEFNITFNNNSDAKDVFDYIKYSLFKYNEELSNELLKEYFSANPTIEDAFNDVSEQCANITKDFIPLTFGELDNHELLPLQKRIDVITNELYNKIQIQKLNSVDNTLPNQNNFNMSDIDDMKKYHELLTKHIEYLAQEKYQAITIDILHMKIKQLNTCLKDIVMEKICDFYRDYDIPKVLDYLGNLNEEFDESRIMYNYKNILHGLDEFLEIVHNMKKQ